MKTNAKRIALFVGLKAVELAGLAIAYCVASHLGHWSIVALNTWFDWGLVDPGPYHVMSVVFFGAVLGVIGLVVVGILIWLILNWQYVCRKLEGK